MEDADRGNLEASIFGGSYRFGLRRVLPAAVPEVSCSRVINILQSLSQATDLKLDDVTTESMQGVCNWFRKRKDDDDNIPWGHRFERAFPNGPQDSSRDLVDIVVLTPDGTSGYAGGGPKQRRRSFPVTLELEP